MKRPWVHWLVGLVPAVFLMIVVPRFFSSQLEVESVSNLMALWLVAYPVFSVLGGILAGWFVNDMWPFILVVPVLYIIGVWTTMGQPVPSTWLQAASYLGFGLIAMLVTALIRYRRAHRDPYNYHFRH